MIHVQCTHAIRHCHRLWYCVASNIRCVFFRGRKEAEYGENGYHYEGYHYPHSRWNRCKQAFFLCLRHGVTMLLLESTRTYYNRPCQFCTHCGSQYQGFPMLWWACPTLTSIGILGKGPLFSRGGSGEAWGGGACTAQGRGEAIGCAAVAPRHPKERRRSEARGPRPPGLAPSSLCRQPQAASLPGCG